MSDAAADAAPRDGDAPGGVAAVGGGGLSYPGGKSGSGIYQRLINLIPKHRVFISAFAGRCGVLRRIRPAEHSIVIDRDPDVCDWWHRWSRSSAGRSIEIHCCDSIEWMHYRFGLSEYSAARSGDTRATPGTATQPGASEAFVFCDPPYVLEERSHGSLYRFELSNGDHVRLLSALISIACRSAADVMLCGYRSPLYATVDRHWRFIDHRVPTRGGLQDERIWLSYESPGQLHDYRFLGDCRRERERIQRRQKSWREQLEQMSEHERQAMLEALNRE